MILLWISIMVAAILEGCKAENPCIKKYYDENSFVCICNATYCDTIAEFSEEDLQNGYVHYESNMKDKRLYLTKEEFSIYKEKSFFDKIWNLIGSFNVLNYYFPASGSFEINPTKKYQEIFGFGGAITDSVGFLLKTLPEEAQDRILRQYFSDTGLNYTFIRMPLGCSDYSPRLYTYDDYGVGHSLANFSLAEEDYQFKIPYIKQIQNISSAPIKIIAAPWIAPQRMMECRYFFFCTDLMKKLKAEFYPTYAEYMIKFLDAYKEEGIEIWGLSPQNEPADGIIGILYPTNLGWTPWEQGEWISKHLGPSLNSSGHQDVKLIIFDDQREFIIIWPTIIMLYAKEYISGIGVHSYLDKYVPAFYVTLSHLEFPNLFIISTEISIQKILIFVSPVRLGRWDNAEDYVNDILEDFNNYVNGWIDWNIVLNDKGGPSFSHTAVDSPIIINDTGKEYYKQPMWYGIAHVSHFVPPGSRRIDLQTPMFTFGLVSAAFETPENRIVIVMLNRMNREYEAEINVGNGKAIKIKTSPRSIHTIIYNKMLQHH